MTVVVARAAPYLTVQDFGRTAHRELGVPRSGAMDRYALGAANALVGNELDAAGLEWALGGGALRFGTGCAFALAGASAEATIGGVAVRPMTATAASAGDTLEIGRFTSERFLYIAISGGIAVERLMGSSATYLPARFGGVDGRLLRSGDILPVGSRGSASTSGFSAPEDFRPDYSRRSIRVIPGPQWSHFSEKDRALFFSQQYVVSRSSDRMGYRLEGEALGVTTGLLPSEAVCEGAIQVPPDGLPIVLMADSPTVGGYPKIGVVETGDLGLLAQLNPGESFQFAQSNVRDAQRRLRRSAASLFTIGELAAKR